MNIFIRSSRDPRKKQTIPRWITTALNSKLFEKVVQAKPKEMVRAEPTNTRTTGIVEKAQSHEHIFNHYLHRFLLRENKENTE